MRGIDISRAYFYEYGFPMLKTEFESLMPFIAVAFVGRGSERFGFDDEVSRDHDFEPGFSIFIPDESVVDSRTAFKLERAYSKLPKEFLGVKRQLLAPVGGNRNGVIRISEFYMNLVGTATGDMSEREWLTVSTHALAEATNGEVFLDNYGEFTKIRNILLDMPEDIRLKRLSENIFLMARFGQYDFRRCIDHNEYDAAQLAVNEFVKATLNVLFLLERKYLPHFKWSFRVLRLFNPSIAEWLSTLLKGDNVDKWVAHTKSELIERISAFVITRLKEQGISDSDRVELSIHAYEVNSKIKKSALRDSRIITGV